MKIDVTLEGGDCPLTFKLSGRLGWTMYQLSLAGSHGVTPLEKPAQRWSSYVHQLRRKGIAVLTEMERHDGAYRGVHARYRLACNALVRIIRTEGGE